MNFGNAVEAIRRTFSKGAVVLLYHRVAELDRDPQLLAVKPRHFAEHLEILRRKANVIPLQKVVQKLDSGLPPRTVAITFDDGYADNLLYAKPLLERYETPATVFVVSGFVGKDQEFWWDELDRILLRPEDSKWNVENNLNREPRHVDYCAMHKAIRSSSDEERSRSLHDLQMSAKCGDSARPTHRVLTHQQLQQLAKGGLVEIGAHTVTHPVLASLAPLTQQREIERSKRELEELVEQSVQSFAYPFGGKRDYNRQSVTLVRNAGFSLACSNFSGMVWRSTNRLELPRMLIRDWSGEKFERMLDAIFQ